jgi:hypothetical protein
VRAAFPQPGFSESDVHDLLASGSFMFADVFSILPVAGDPLYYTNYQQDVTIVPVFSDPPVYRTYFSRVLNIDGLRTVSSIGIQVDEQDIDLDFPVDPLAFQNRMSWPQAILYGILDGATVRRDRYIRANPDSPWVGGWTMFKGLVSSINSVGRSSAVLRVKSNLVLLDVEMPRDFYEPNCKNTWGDANCGIDQLDFMTLGTVGPSPTRSVIPWSGSSVGYSLGKIQISSGDNTIRVRTISKATSTHLYLSYPLDFDPVAAQVFEAFLGCNRTATRCEFFHGSTEWKNRYKGFPFVPVAETAIGIGVVAGES